MSNIYIQEPPTDGKVLLVTTVGDIDVELWSKETPRACRNFVQLCLEGYYDGTPFHRVVPGFIAQGGDPTGTGTGGDSIYGAPFKDEFHSRLRFNRRGLLGMANSKSHDNGSQFFFTLGEAGELNNKHTLFGKVTGDTIYNMVKLGEGDVNDEVPSYLQKIIKTKVLSNPFTDIVPRKIERESTKISKKVKTKGKKDFKLLSFGEEAEEDEEQSTEAANTMKSQSIGKSSHDMLDDEKLSTIPAVDQSFQTSKKKKKKKKRHESDEESSSSEEEDVKTMVRKKLRKENTSSMNFRVDENSDEDNPQSEKNTKMAQKIKELRREAKQLKKDLKENLDKKSEKSKAETNPEEHEEEEESNDLIKQYKAEKKAYKQEKVKLKKGSDREASTLAMLASFQSKLSSAQMLAKLGGSDDEEGDAKEQDEDEYDPTDMSWMTHKLTFEEHNRKVIDANTADLDRYEMFDPRNPLNVRKREASKKAMKEGKSKRTV